MIRGIVSVLCFVSASAVAFVVLESTATGQATNAAGMSHTQGSIEDRLLLQQYGQLPEDTRLSIERESSRQGADIPVYDENLRQAEQMMPQAKATIFRSIKEELKPIVVRGDRFIDPFVNRVLPVAAVPRGAEADTVLRLERSVGRIEVANGTRHIGTGFVIGDGLIATNCHVARELVSAGAGEAWRLRNAPDSSTPFLVDFGDGRAHDATREYVIESVTGIPEKPFLDIAVLRVSRRSVSGAQPLPPKLPIRAARLEHDWASGPLSVAVLGYPDLTSIRTADPLTQTMFRRIWEDDSDNVKLFSPGSAVGLDTFNEIEFVDHIASTLAGQSGSPVIERASGEVIGVHYCCTAPGLPPQSDAMACSSQRLSDLQNNQAVSVWTARTDRVIGSLFGGTLGPPAVVQRTQSPGAVGR